jgi:hypothetical protein
LHGKIVFSGSSASVLRSRKSTSHRSSAVIASRAAYARRRVFEISPGHVCSLRVDPFTTRIRVGPVASAWRAVACAMAARVASHSSESS